MIHIGNIIHEEMIRQQRSVSWLARHIGCGRASVYRIYERNYISTDLLWNISIALNHDFFADLSKSFSSDEKISSQH